MKRHSKTRSKRPLSAEKLQRREAVFTIYRDMGPGRTYERLIEMARSQHGPISRRTLVNWSGQHNWRTRLVEHDQRLTAAGEPPVELGPDFDMVEALKRIAVLVVQRALRMHADGKPRDLKALVETAEKALMLADKAREMRMAQQSPEEKAEHQQRLRRVMEHMKGMARERLAREGHPVQDFVSPEETVDETPEGAGASTVH
jgi:hypothetical protein